MYFAFTGSSIGDTGTTSLSESLKSNTKLKKLNLSSEDKKDIQKTSINNSLFPFLYSSTGNKIGDAGATSLSESLKSNTTLTQLNLSGKDQRKNTHKDIRQQITLFPFLFTSTDNDIGERGATSLSESLKSNTTLTELNLWSEDKRKKTQKKSTTISLFSFYSH